MSWLCKTLCRKTKERYENEYQRLTLEIAQVRTEVKKLQKVYNELLDNSSATKKELNKQITEKTLQIQELQTHILEYQKKLQQYGKLIIPENLQKLIDLYYDKYTHRTISHVSYLFAAHKKSFIMNICNWITPHDLVVEEWANQKQIPKVSTLILDGHEFHEACDLIVTASAKAWRPNYKWDNKEWINYNITDMWQMPFQTLKAKQGDCEDFTNAFLSILSNRGIPQGLIRNACGETYNGYGHSTAHYLATDLKWHHIECTSSHSRDILDMPDIHDARDKANIKTIWYSFNNDYSWNEWMTGAKENYKKYKRNKYTIIR